MNDTSLNAKLDQLEVALRDQLRRCYSARWEQSLRETIAKEGPIDESRAEKIADFFLQEFVDFSALVALETLGRKYLKYGMVNEATDKIIAIVERAAEMRRTGDINLPREDDDEYK